MLRHLLGLFAVSALATTWASAAMNVSGVVNAASYVPPGMPNSAIAQGSMFTVFGNNLGPAQIVSGSYPLGASLSGTSARVTVNGVTVSPLILYTSASQLAMVMPSSTPVGSGTITIAYNGQASAPIPVQVAESSFGMFSMNQAGTGPAVVTDTDYAYISLTHAANPGQTLVLWGTGLGKVTADETMPAPAGNVGAKPTVWVGSQQANLLYWGRSGCCSGLDQINFQIPAGVSGCYVPVAVQTAGGVSNFGSIAVADSGRMCSDPVGLGSAELTRAQNGQDVSLATLRLLRSTVSLNPAFTAVSTTTTTDSASATFLRYTPNQLASSSFGQAASAGGCMVFPISAGNVTDPIRPLGLDSGGVTLGGSNGTKTLTPSISAKGFYGGTLGSSDGPPFLYLDPSAGPHTFNGFGGNDVGAIYQEVSMPQPLTWVNQGSISTVNESQGVTVSWTNAAPGGYVMISGYSSLLDQNGNAGAGASFSCSANAGPGGTGQFTVPPHVLASLPLSPPSASPKGFLGISSMSPRQRMSATRGIDAGFAQSSVQIIRSVTYAQ